MADMLFAFMQENPGIDVPTMCEQCGDHDSVGCEGCSCFLTLPEPPRKEGWPSPKFWQ